ncbi:hypothetical protein PTKIN_Ptkin16aG0476300 [Pterospermum kingtungense]
MTLEDPLIELEAPLLPSCLGQLSNTNSSKQKASKLKSNCFRRIGYERSKNLHLILDVFMLIMIGAAAYTISLAVVIYSVMGLFGDEMLKVKLRIEIDGSNGVFNLVDLGCVAGAALLSLACFFSTVATLVVMVCQIIIVPTEIMLKEVFDIGDEEEEDMKFETPRRFRCILGGGCACFSFVTAMMGWKTCYDLEKNDTNYTYRYLFGLVSFAVGIIFCLVHDQVPLKKENGKAIMVALDQSQENIVGEVVIEPVHGKKVGHNSVKI